MAHQMALPGLNDSDLPREITEFICAECENVRDIDDAHEIDGEKYCPDCVHSCEACGHTGLDEDDFVDAQDTYRRDNSLYVCKDCAHKCADCGDYFTENYRENNGGCNTDSEWVCCECSESYYTCDACSAIIHSDNMRSNDCGETFCESCYDDNNEHGSTHLVRDYSYKPTPVFHYANGESRTVRELMGIEVESECGDDSDIDDDLTRAGLTGQELFYAKEDGSIGNGAELVSHPATWEFWKEYNFAMFDKLRSRRWRAYDTETCGMHVHISRTSFTKEGLRKLLKFFRDNASTILRLSRRRSMSALAEWAGIDEGDDNDITYKLEKPNHSNSRYEAVNISNANTIEIRIFRSTLSPKGIKRNIAFCATLPHFVRDVADSELTAEGYADWLNEFGKGIIGEPEASELIEWVNGVIRPVDVDA